MKTVSLTQKLSQFGLPMVVLVSMFSTVMAQAQTSPEGHYRTENGTVVFNLKACRAMPCELSYGYAKVRVITGNPNATNGIAYVEGGIRISSNLKIINANITHDSSTGFTQSVNRNITTLQKQNSVLSGYKAEWVTPQGQPKEIIVISHSVSAIEIKNGAVLSLVEDLRAVSSPLVVALQGIQEHLVDFKQIVARDSSDARHLTRLEIQVNNLVNAMIDKEKGTLLLPITHSRVTEGARMIMVLSTVLEEITDRYNWSAPLLQSLLPAKEALNQLSKQIREAYGWRDGLAGSGSKALASLSAILDSELKSMLMIVSASNDQNITVIFNQLFVANQMLYNRVAASNAGDVAGSELAKALIAKWNSAEFQKILSAMMSAPQTAQAQFQNRILMAMTAMESIKDYVDPKGDSRVTVELPANVRAKLPKDTQIDTMK